MDSTVDTRSCVSLRTLGSGPEFDSRLVPQSRDFTLWRLQRCAACRLTTASLPLATSQCAHSTCATKFDHGVLAAGHCTFMVFVCSQDVRNDAFAVGNGTVCIFSAMLGSTTDSCSCRRRRCGRAASAPLGEEPRQPRNRP